jgi:hypothetical protein
MDCGQLPIFPQTKLGGLPIRLDRLLIFEPYLKRTYFHENFTELVEGLLVV